MVEQNTEYVPKNVLEKLKTNFSRNINEIEQNPYKDLNPTKLFDCNMWTATLANMQLEFLDRLKARGEKGKETGDIKNIESVEDKFLEFRDLAYEIWRKEEPKVTLKNARDGLRILNNFLKIE